MPLTTKLIADYIELINHQLDNLLIETIDDFESVREALNHIIPPPAPRYLTRFVRSFSRNLNQTTYVVPEKYQESMDYIKSFLEEPENYVQDRANYNQYKRIIRERIAAKIKELQNLSEPRKQAYIQAQSARRAQVTANQAIMSQHQAPTAGSGAHSLSTQQWLAERTQVFSQTIEETPLIVRLFGLTVSTLATEAEIQDAVGIVSGLVI